MWWFEGDLDSLREERKIPATPKANGRGETPVPVEGGVSHENLASMLLGLFVELFERFSIPSFPNNKSVCAPAMYNGRCRRWARELGVFGKDKEPAFLDQRAISNELFALG